MLSLIHKQEKKIKTGRDLFLLACLPRWIRSSKTLWFFKNMLFDPRYVFINSIKIILEREGCLLKEGPVYTQPSPSYFLQENNRVEFPLYLQGLVASEPPTLHRPSFCSFVSLMSSLPSFLIGSSSLFAFCDTRTLYFQKKEGRTGTELGPSKQAARMSPWRITPLSLSLTQWRLDPQSLFLPTGWHDDNQHNFLSGANFPYPFRASGQDHDHPCNFLIPGDFPFLWNFQGKNGKSVQYFPRHKSFISEG